MSTAVTAQQKPAPNDQQKPAPLEQQIESAINRTVAGGISASSKGGLVISSMSEALEFAKLMSLAKEGVPKHCRGVPGICLSICIQGFEWGISPFALANKSYVVNDRVCYEASLYQSVVARRAPIVGRIRMSYEGENDKRRCKVWAQLNESNGGGNVEYTSPLFSAINPKNSPLWKNDPDQQLFYFSVRAFARRHFPDVMMGVYTVDEMMDADTIDVVQTVDTRPKSERMADRLLGTAVEADQVTTPDPHDQPRNHEPYNAALQIINAIVPGDQNTLNAAKEAIADCERDGMGSGELDELRAALTRKVAS